MFSLESLVKIIIVWLCFDAVVITVGWYLVTVIKPRYPNWWRRVIADRDPWEF